jgi:hypothetical protein
MYVTFEVNSSVTINNNRRFYKITCLELYIKSKAVPLHAMEALGGEDVQLLLILDLGTRWG